MAFRTPLRSIIASYARTKLQSAGLQLVAIDLPGCGGSDDLQQYSADEVLNATVDAIAQLRSRYLTNNTARRVLVGHDWGGLIAYRIAAGTRGLVHRVVAINTALRRYTPTAEDKTHGI